MAQSFPHKIPTPPSSRPSSSKRSRHKVLHTSFKKISQTCPELSNQNYRDNDSFVTMETNLKRYSLLPAIGSSDTFFKHNNTILDDGSGTTTTTSNHKTDGGQVEFPVHHDTIDLAVRLLDGSRVQHQFYGHNTFRNVLDYLISVTNTESLSSTTEFVTCDFPQKSISDLSLSLTEANIKTKTLLCLREIDPD